MTPTARLRFVKREIKASHPAMNALAPKQYQTILQQWWQQDDFPIGEWRDVEVEENP